MYRQTSYHASPRRTSSSRHFSGNTRPRRSGGSHKQQIDPKRFVKAATIVEEAIFVPKQQFADFEVHDLLKENIIQKGFVTPSPIQDEAIPHGLSGRDIVGIANTGTGKTAAFSIPLLHQLLINPKSKALIIAPTRELAQQIEADCRSFARGSGLNGALLIGGTAMGPQLRDLKNRPSIVIGTPGRIKDHYERRSLELGSFNIVVLDEVDRMVDMGFIADIRFLLGKVASIRQSYFFSATLDPKLQQLVESFLTDPITISVKTGETSQNVHQDVVRYTSPSEKMEKLHDSLNHADSKKVLIFDQTQRSVERLSNELLARGFKADAIHGGKSQGQRQRALDRFKKDQIDILVATDVAARGIDVADITHVINFSQPNTYDDYIHRIGRTGRAGRVGYALTFVN